MFVYLKRFCLTPEYTFGVFEINNAPICVSLELPWLDNEKMVSCIPVGDYQCVKLDTVERGEVIYVQNVPGRTEILIHPANFTSELLGCIAPGTYFDKRINEPCVMSSRDALNRLLASVPETFTLKIRECLWRD